MSQERKERKFLTGAFQNAGTSSKGDPDDVILAMEFTMPGHPWGLSGTGSEVERQKKYLGQVIDSHILAGRLAIARAACQKLIRIAPDVVRAHCTLAFIALVEGEREEFISEIPAYVGAARAAGTERYAIARLRIMAVGSDDPHVLRVLAKALQEIGAEKIGAELLEWARELDCRGIPPQRQMDPEHKAWLLQAAILGPRDLWDPYWLNLDRRTLRTA